MTCFTLALCPRWWWSCVCQKLPPPCRRNEFLGAWPCFGGSATAGFDSTGLDRAKPSFNGLLCLRQGISAAVTFGSESPQKNPLENSSRQPCMNASLASLRLNTLLVSQKTDAPKWNYFQLFIYSLMTDIYQIYSRTNFTARKLKNYITETNPETPFTTHFKISPPINNSRDLISNKSIYIYIGYRRGKFVLIEISICLNSYSTHWFWHCGYGVVSFT